MHSLLRFWAGKFVLAAAFITASLVVMLSGCDDPSVAPISSETSSTRTLDSDAPLPPDVRLRIQYDQTEITYSNVWPGSLIGNNNAKKKGAKLMTEFERTHEIRSYDDEGYLTASYEYLDGSHPHMNMPQRAYSDLKSEMPYNPEDQNPIVRSVLQGETLTYVREDGNEEQVLSVEPDVYRVDPAKLDSLEEVRDDTSDADSRRSATRRSLRRRGISFSKIGPNRVSFTRRLKGGKGGSNKAEVVVDLRVGRPIYIKYLLKNGTADMIVTRQYAQVSGIPIMRKSVTYNYDDWTGSWTVVSRSEVIRDNISVRFN